MAVVDYGLPLEAVPDAAVVHEPTTGEILAANDAYCEMMDYSEDELLGAELWQFAAGDWAYGSGRRVEQARADGSVRFDWSVRTGTGEDLPVEVQLGLTTHGGEAVAVATIRATPDRRERKQELEAYRRRERALFDNNQLILWEMDLSTAKEYADQLASETDDLVAYLDDNPEEIGELNRRIDVEYLNQKTLDFYEVDSEAELLANLDETITEQSFEGLKRLWAGIAAGETTIRKECEVSTFENNRRVELLEWNVPEAYADDYARVYATSIDITDRKKREQEVQRKNELLDEFASVVSHDISTPLSTVRNKAKLIAETGDPSHAEDIYDASERVQNLVDRLQGLASQGKEVGETSPVVLETAARETWRSIRTPNATLRIESSPVIEAGRLRLQQLLENLLTNAIEHGSTASQDGPANDDGQHGTVTITIGELDNGFYVADDGPGIPEAERENVFEQGYTTSEDSLGLGLAIVQRIADGHDWTTTVTESEAGGARFEIWVDEIPEAAQQRADTDSSGV